MNTNKSVFFAIPSYKGTQCPPFFESLEATSKACEKAGWRAEFSAIVGCCYIQVARNKLINRFMKSGCESLFFLDDDISWDSKDILRLLELKDEIVAGIYPRRGAKDNYPVVIRTDENRYPIVRGDGCIVGFRVPTGFLRIKRSAIEKLMKAYPQQRYSIYDVDGKFEEYEYDFFPQGVQNGRWIGEDFAFCRLWGDIGEQIWIVPNIDFRHYQGKEYVEGNYHQFLLCQPGGPNATENRKTTAVLGGRLVPC